jgi:glucose 1-dehydrogenase
MDLKGKIAVITGSSSGIGKAAALAFAREGSKIVVNSLKNVKDGKTVVQEIKKLGSDAIYVQGDVSKQKDVNMLFNETVKKFGTWIF